MMCSVTEMGSLLDIRKVNDWDFLLVHVMGILLVCQRERLSDLQTVNKMVVLKGYERVLSLG